MLVGTLSKRRILWSRAYRRAVENGYTIARVYNIPEKNYGLSSFIFAKDKEENQFYLHVDKFEHGWNRWGYIKHNDKLAIKYEDLKNEKATEASEILEIDKYQM